MDLLDEKMDKQSRDAQTLKRDLNLELSDLMAKLKKNSLQESEQHQKYSQDLLEWEHKFKEQQTTI